MKKRVTLLLLLVTGVAFGVEQLVNQGAPGNRGPWPVTISGGGGVSIGNVVIIGADGGSNPTVRYLPVATTTALSANATACTTAGGASCTIILAANDLSVWQNITFTLNNSGANAITNVMVEDSPDNTNWELWDTGTFAGIAAGGVTSIAISGNSRRWWRIEARAAAATTAVVTVTANTGW